MPDGVADSLLGNLLNLPFHVWRVRLRLACDGQVELHWLAAHEMLGVLLESQRQSMRCTRGTKLPDGMTCLLNMLLHFSPHLSQILGGGRIRHDEPQRNAFDLEGDARHALQDGV